LIKSTYFPEEYIKEFVKSFVLPNFAAVPGRLTSGRVDFTTMFPFMEPTDKWHAANQRVGATFYN